MTRTTTGSVALENNASIFICRKSFFTGGVPAFFGELRRAHGGYGTFFTAVVLIISVIFIGALFGDLPARAQEAFTHTAAAPLAAAPHVRSIESSYLSVIPFETITYYDAKIYSGDTVVTVEGKNGLRRVTERREYSGGELTSVTAVSSTVISEPVDKIVAIGVLKRPQTASYGTYMWPAKGTITSNFGRRSVSVGSKNHQGIDIAGAKGDAIYAADGGEIIRADNKLTGYGLLVQIKHDNGDITYYGHNSEVLVSVGERVFQGQEIAKMGSTGISSGVHLHFEIRVDGTPVNPASYLP